MKVTIEVPEWVRAKVRAEHDAKAAACSDEWERAQMSIWSDQELLQAEAEVLLRFHHEGRIKFI